MTTEQTKNPKIIYWDSRESNPLDDVIRQIDEIGGWPAAAESIVYKHTTDWKRECYFSKISNIRDEWNSSFLTRDEYYWYKISKNFKKAKFQKEILNLLMKFRHSPLLDEINVI
jgi:hypothetical protein